MPGHFPTPPLDHEAQLGLVVANLFREEGWKVLDQPRDHGVVPDLIASRPGKKLVVEIKRASEGRKDRVIPLLSQAALEASFYSRNIPGHPLPVAIIGANHMPEPVAEEAKRFLQERAPEVAVGLVDLGDVPFVTSALHLRLELGVGHRRHSLHADTGRLGEGLEESGLLRRGPAAAPGIDEYRPRLRERAPGRQQRTRGSSERGTSRLQQPASIENSAFLGVHGILYAALAPIFS